MTDMQSGPSVRGGSNCMIFQGFAAWHAPEDMSTATPCAMEHRCRWGGSKAVTCELACCSSAAALRGLSMLAVGGAMLSLAFSNTADARRLTRRPWVMTCRRRSNVHRAARVLTFPLSAHTMAKVLQDSSLWQVHMSYTLARIPTSISHHIA